MAGKGIEILCDQLVSLIVIMKNRLNMEYGTIRRCFLNSNRFLLERK